MDTQKDQFGTTPDQTNANRPATTSATGGASRKASPLSAASDSAALPTAQSPASAPDAQTTASAGADRQGEGQQTNGQEGTLLDTALNSGKKWIEDSGVLNNVNQLPQTLKDLGNRAVARVNDLSTAQKVVGGAILAVGLGWLATRKGKSSSDQGGSPYNYGRQRDAGYGRRNYGYQAPDASNSRRPAAGSGRSDSGAPYGTSGSRYGSSSASGQNTGTKSGSGRADSDSSFGASATTDHGSQSASGDSHRSKNDGFRTIE